jgi:hypothetical protein
MKISLLDHAFAGSPADSASTGDYNWPCKHIQWDRDSIGDILVLTDGALEENIDRLDSIDSKVNIGWLIEPRSYAPERYHKISNPEFYNKLDYIITHEKYLLDISDKFIYYAPGGCWIDPEDRRIHEKSKNISIIASFKRQLPGHVLRHDCIRAFHMFIDGIYGNGYNPVEHKIQALKDYRYSIIIENVKSPDCFTEKLIDCFITGTIPIYYGAPGIDEFFNIKGMYIFDNLQDLHKIISQCSEEDYNNKLPYILENLDISKNYTHSEDWIYNNIIINERYNIV